uniref:Uncharacterized protein n=1 Tax=Cacopsylla melanoneura TaxID=428564 RepID=A0A8D8RTF4_9HEMI
MFYKGYIPDSNFLKVPTATTSLFFQESLREFLCAKFFLMLMKLYLVQVLFTRSVTIYKSALTSKYRRGWSWSLTTRGVTTNPHIIHAYSDYKIKAKMVH